jgi:hypothetical protein
MQIWVHNTGLRISENKVPFFQCIYSGSLKKSPNLNKQHHGILKLVFVRPDSDGNPDVCGNAGSAAPYSSQRSPSSCSSAAGPPAASGEPFGRLSRRLEAAPHLGPLQELIIFGHFITAMFGLVHPKSVIIKQYEKQQSTDKELLLQPPTSGTVRRLKAAKEVDTCRVWVETKLNFIFRCKKMKQNF